MRLSRFVKVVVAFLVSALLIQLLHACDANSNSTGKTNLTIATVNNGDMVVMQELSSQFEADNPDIRLRWVVLDENVLRQRTTTDIASQKGQFDVMTIGAYETPIWAKRGWLQPLEAEALPEDYDVDDLLAQKTFGK